MAKPSSMLTWAVIRDGLQYALAGGLRLGRGHLPVDHHTVPADFFGVGVASQADAEADYYLIRQLNTLGIKQVRLDLSYDDLISHQGRFCTALLDAGFALTLRLIPPPESARELHTTAELAHWRAFVDAVLARFGSRVKQIEVGNAINRRRWAGYTWAGFYAAWDVAYQACKAANVRIIGANIQDFEPLYNAHLLKSLRAKQQLPAAQSNNLFAERVGQPERFDFRVFRFRWARIFKFNLVKKARILQSLGQHFGVPHTLSTGAFWAIYRIERVLAQGAQKQADYLTRYFTVLAASGALKQAFWGTFVCHREGLIDDGLQDGDYPDLERIAHYKSCDGMPTNYQPYPSFYAMQTVAANLADAQYIDAIATASGLEIHRFLRANLQLHVAWTINGKAVPLNEVYAQTALQSARYQHRDGHDFEAETPDLICETPLYLSWPRGVDVQILDNAANQTGALSIFAHMPKTRYFTCPQTGWAGLIAANNHDEMTQILAAFNPEQLTPPSKQDSLRHARNVIWAMPNPLEPNTQIAVKKPVKMYWHKQLLDRYRPSKARRSWNGAMELLRRNIATPKPLAFFERVGDTSLKQNFYLCAFEPADCDIGQVFNAFAAGETQFMGLAEEQVYAQMARFIKRMHYTGCYFRDLSGGNILVKINAPEQLEFSLIDTARARFGDHALPLHQCLADLTRACHKLHWAGRERLLGHYLGLSGRHLQWYHKVPFMLYDAKIWLKRRIGRKGIKKLKQRFFG